MCVSGGILTARLDSLSSPLQDGTKRGHLPGFPLVTECCDSVSPLQTCLSKPEHALGVSGVGGHSKLRSHGGVGGPCEVKEGAVCHGHLISPELE